VTGLTVSWRDLAHLAGDFDKGKSMLTSKTTGIVVIGLLADIYLLYMWALCSGWI
jgi:hypothetical protein